MRPKSSCPARPPRRASSGVVSRGNSSMSAPAAKTNGLPVSTIAAQSPVLERPSAAASDSSAARPNVVGFV